MPISELEQLVAMLEKAGDGASAAKHKTHSQREEEATGRCAVRGAPVATGTQAHQRSQELNQKLEKAVGHYERLAEGLEQQRLWVQQLTDELEATEQQHRTLVVELNAQVVESSQQSQPAQPLSVAGILDGTIAEIPLSFAGLGFDDDEFEMDDNEKQELADRTTRLQADLAAAVKAMFGQAAEKAKAYKAEQEQMAKRLQGKRRRKEDEGGTKAEAPEAPGPAAAAAPAESSVPTSQSASAASGQSLKDRANRICRPQPPQADSA